MCRGGPASARAEKSQSKDKPNVNEVKANDAEKEKQDAEIGTLTGSWFLINGLQSPATDGLINEVSNVFTSELREGSTDPKSHPQLSAFHQKHQQRRIHHHVINEFGKWVTSNVSAHGKIQVHVKLDPSAQQQLDLDQLPNTSSTTVSTLADTGKQMCVADWAIAKKLNLKKSDLLMPALTVSVADNASLELIGAHLLTLSTSTGLKTQQLVYFASGVGDFYLSKTALIDLKIVPSNFPSSSPSNTVSVNTLQNDVKDIIGHLTLFHGGY